MLPWVDYTSLSVYTTKIRTLQRGFLSGMEAILLKRKLQQSEESLLSHYVFFQVIGKKFVFCLLYKYAKTRKGGGGGDLWRSGMVV